MRFLGIEKITGLDKAEKKCKKISNYEDEHSGILKLHLKQQDHDYSRPWSTEEA